MADNPSDLSNFIASFGANSPSQTRTTVGEQKKARINTAADTKKLNFGNGRNISEEKMTRDIRESNLGINDVPDYQRGLTIDQLAAYSDVRDQVRDVDRTRQSAGEFAADTGLGVISGFGSAVEGFAALNNMAVDAMGITNPLLTEPSRALERGAGKFSDFFQGYKSDSFNTIQERAQADRVILQDQNKREAERSIAAGDDKLITNLKRVGKDFLDGGSTFLSNPTLIADAVAESTASIVTSAGGGALIGKAGTIAKQMAAGKTAKEAAEFVASKAGQKAVRDMSVASQPFLSGLMEAGGGAAGARQLIDGMSHEQLLNSSPEYQALIESGITPEQAKDTIRVSMTREMAAMSGMAGLVMGNFTKAFDAAPLSGGIRSFGSNAVGESIEEGVQGLASQGGENLSVQKHIDPTQDVLEGVGGAMAEGALAGAGMVGAMQGPGATIKGTAQAAVAGAGAVSTGVTAAAGAASTGAGYINRVLGKRTQEQIDADSVTSTEAIQERSDAVTAILDTTFAPETPAAPTAEPVEEGEAPASETETKTEAEEPVFRSPQHKQIHDLMKITEDSIEDDHVKDAVKDTDGNLPTNKYEYLNRLISVYKDNKEIPEEQRNDFAIEIFNQIMDVNSIGSDELTANLLDESTPAEDREALDQIQIAVARLSETPAAQDAVKFVQSLMVEETPEALTQDITETSETEVKQAAQKEVSKIVAVATEAPQNVAPQVISDVLDLARKRVIHLAPQTVKMMESAANISKLVSLYSDDPTVVGNTESKGRKTADEVRDNILTQGFDGESGEARHNSFVGHATRIGQSLMQGKTADAKTYMQSLSNFAKSQSNKIAALDASSKDGKAHAYDAWVPSERAFVNTVGRPDSAGFEKYQIHKGNKKSLDLYKQTFEDTSIIIALQNSLATQFPELGIEPIQMPKTSRSVAQHLRLLGQPRTAKIAKATRAIQKAADKVWSPTIQKRLTKEAGGKRPLMDHLIKTYGGVRTGSRAAAELKQLGVTPSNARGLFKSDNGHRDLDNIPASVLPHLAAMLGTDDNGNINPSALFEALRAEADGNPQHLTFEQKAAYDELQSRIEEQDRLDREQREKEAAAAAKTAAEAAAPKKKITEEEPSSSGSNSEESTEETTEETEEVKPKVKSLKERFTGLVTFKGETSTFERSFKADPNSTSFLLDKAEPIKEVFSHIFYNEDEGSYPMNDYIDHVLPLANNLIKNMQDRLNDVNQKRKLYSYHDKGKNEQGGDSSDNRNMRVLKFTRYDAETQTFTYDQTLVETMALAVADWWANADLNSREDIQDRMEKIGINYDVGMNPDEARMLSDFLNGGVIGYAAMEDISRKFMTYMGIQPADNVNLEYSQGAVQAFAVEALQSLADLGKEELDKDGNVLTSDKLVKKAVETIDINGNEVTLVAFKFNDHGFIPAKVRKSVQKLPDLLNSIILPDAPKLFQIGKPLDKKNRPTTILRSNEKLSPLEQESLHNQSSVPFKRNEHLFNIYDKLNENIVKQLFGYTNVRDQDRPLYNQKDLQSIDGANNGIQTDYEDAMLLREAMLAQDEDTVYFNHERNSVARMQMTGPNVQNNKIMRSLIKSTIHEMDLSKDADGKPKNQEHWDTFWLAMGQMGGVSKVELANPEGLSDTIIEALDKKYGPVITELERWAADSDVELNEQVFTDNLKGISPETLNVLQTMARFRHAEKTGGDLSKFDNSVPLEADGVSNGSAMLYLKNTTGEFTVGQLAMFEKFGFFVGNDKRSLWSRNPDRDPSNPDYYGTVSNTAKANIRAVDKRLASVGPEALEIKNRMMRFLNHFPSGFSERGFEGRIPSNLDQHIQEMVQWEFEMSRNAAKAPSTQIGYGSGAKSVARKLTSMLMGDVYSKMSELNFKGKGQTPAQYFGYPEFMDDLMFLTNNYIGLDDEGKMEVVRDRAFDKKGMKASNFVLNKKAFDNIANTMENIYGRPMHKAVKATLGDGPDGAYRNMNAVIQATGLQSKIYAAAYDAFLRKFPGDKLPTPDELREWNKRFKKLGVVIKSRYQTFDITKTAARPVMNPDKPAPNSKRERERNKRSGTSLTEFATFDFRLPQPADIGVAAAPFTTIGGGDGYMMMTAHTDEVIKKHPFMGEFILQIYDGEEAAPLFARQVGEIMNEKALDAATNDTIQGIYNSHMNFIRNLSDELVAETEIDVHNLVLDLKDGIPKNDGTKYTIEDLRPHLEINTERLKKLAEQTAARAKALRDVPLSVDQMAAANSPYYSEGKGLLEDDTPEGRVKKLNERYHFHLNQTKDIQQKIKKTNTVLDQAVMAVAPTIPGTQIRQFSMEQFRGLFKHMHKSDQEIYNKVIKDNLAEDYTVLFGPAAELEAQRVEKYLNPNDTSITENIHGRIDKVNRVMYFPDENISAQAIIHEGLHLATHEVIDGYYLGTEARPEVSAAVERLEALMHEFLGLYFGKDHKELNETMNQIRALRHFDREADALNEFVAEVMSSRNIVSVAKQQRVTNPLALLKQKVVGYLKKMFRIRDNPGDSFYNNVFFNAQIIARAYNPDGTPTGSDPVSGPRGGASSSGSLDMARGAPTSNRAKAVHDKINSALLSALSDNDLAYVQRNNTTKKDDFMKSIEGFVKAGFHFTQDEATAYMKIMALWASDTVLDGPAIVRLQEIYEKVRKDLKIEHFLPDPTYTKAKNPAAWQDAEAKYDAVMGVSRHVRRVRGSDRSSNLTASFLALAAVNDEFRNILNQLDAPKAQKATYGNTDEALSSVTEMLIDNGTTLILGEKRGVTSSSAIDNLLGDLIDIEGDRPTQVEKVAQGLMDKADEKLSKFLYDATEKIAPSVDRFIARQPKTKAGMLKSTLGLIPKLLISMANPKRASIYRKSWFKFLNDEDTRPFHTFRDLMTELASRHEDNAAFYDKVDENKWNMGHIRQAIRDGVPEYIASVFTRKLTDEEYAVMQTAIAHTDSVAILKTGGMPDLRKAYSDPKFLQRQINNLSTNFAQNELDAAQKLADFMVTGARAHGMIRNPMDIIRVFQPTIPQGDKEALYEQLDVLVSYMAIQKLPQALKDKTTELFNTEGKGMEQSINILAETRYAEYNKRGTNGIPGPNEYKGYFPTENEPGKIVTIAPAKDHRKLAMTGYVRLGDYNGSRSDPERGKLAYYYNPNSGHNTYTQGSMQTVEIGVNGIDPITGRSLGGHTSSIIKGPQVALIAQRLQTDRAAKDGEHLSPIINHDGEVVAFERLLSQDMQKMRGEKRHFGKMLGAMAGRQYEEREGVRANDELIDMIYDSYKNDVDTEKWEYINIAKSDDPVHKDIWDNVIPRHTKDKIVSRFGKDFFPIRADLEHMILGYRNAGVTDVFTGITRLPKDIQTAFHTIMINMFGRKAFNRFVTAERAWMSGISEVKDWIIVRSMIVPAANLLSGIVQLLAMGVPISQVVKGYTRKFIETNKFLENQKKGNELQLQLKGTRNNNEKARIRNEIQILLDANRKLSIWPLIDAGKFATIAEGQTQIDDDIFRGKVTEWIEAKVEKLPDGVKTLGRYGIVSKSTSLYKGLNRLTQYGDFLGKAVLYDHFTQTQNMSSKEAIGLSGKMFIVYNVPPGRARTYLETMGLQWFWTYKLRAMAVAQYMAQHNPARLLMSSLMMPSFGTPLGNLNLGHAGVDNGLTQLFDGSLGRSVGVSPAFSAHELLPIGQLVFK